MTDHDIQEINGATMDDFRNLKAMMEEDLDPELEPYLVEGRLGPVVHHPLVVALFPVNGMVNRTFKAKQKAVAEALAERNWFRWVFMHERPYRSDALSSLVDNEDAAASLDAQEWAALVRSVWIDAEMPSSGADAWDIIFEESLYELNMDLLSTGEERWEYWWAVHKQGDGGKITIYRGINDPEYTDHPGRSWTLDREKALWFAQRFALDDGGVLLTATIDGSEALAYFTDRGESEVLLAPHTLEELDYTITPIPTKKEKKRT